MLKQKSANNWICLCRNLKKRDFLKSSFECKYCMLKLNRLKNRSIARLANSFPVIAKQLEDSFVPLESKDIPWTPVRTALDKSKIALVTTSGIHHGYQEPFNMDGSTGDPSYRILDINTIEEDYMITHDYYDHRDADKDLNIIFPIAWIDSKGN